MYDLLRAALNVRVQHPPASCLAKMDYDKTKIAEARQCGVGTTFKCPLLGRRCAGKTTKSGNRACPGMQAQAIKQLALLLKAPPQGALATVRQKHNEAVGTGSSTGREPNVEAAVAEGCVIYASSLPVISS